MENFKNCLRAYMAEKKLSQVDISRLAGVSQGSLSKFLNVRGRDLKLSSYLQLAKLVYGSPLPPPPDGDDA
jgi:transcriptional regulator with XRE-family HTH domain